MNISDDNEKSIKEEITEILTASFQNNFGDKIPTTILKKLIIKDYRYLNYANRSNIDFYEMLNLAYQKELEKIGRKAFSKKESDLLEKYLKNNSSLFNTLNIEILNENIINLVGEDNLELIVRYPSLENLILELSNYKEVLDVFNFTFNHLKKHYKFQVPLIEEILKKLDYRLIKSNNKKEIDNFIKIISDKIQDDTYIFTEEEKNIISYITLNLKNTKNIKDYSYIKNYLEIYKQEQDEIFLKNPTYQNFINRFLGDFSSLKFKIFNDLDKLKEKYKDVDENSNIELQLEKKSLEILDNLNQIDSKSLNDSDQKTYYVDLYNKYKEHKIDMTSENLLSSIILDKYLKNIYAKEFLKKINSDNKKLKEYKTLSGKSYYIKELDEDFGRIVSVMGAFNTNIGSKEKNFYNRWNTRKLSENHALCYSYINESNPSVADDSGKKIIVAINNFDSESLIGMSNEDMKSTTFTPKSVLNGPRYYLPDSLANNTRRGYSELVIELQDIKEKNYKKIQPSSIICFEKIDDISIKAAIDLSEKLGKIIPIELIDRRKLALKEMDKIKQDYKEFIENETKDIELVKDIINRFHNVRNAHLCSYLRTSIIGEDFKGKIINPEALFSINRMEEILQNIYIYMNDNDFTKEEVKEINKAIEKENNHLTNAISYETQNMFKRLESVKENGICDKNEKVIC